MKRGYFGTEAGRRDLVCIIVAALMFTPLFVLRQVGPFDFWWWMSANLIVLITAGAATDRHFAPHILSDLREGVPWKTMAGLASALALYAVFAVGDVLSRQLFDFAAKNIDAVYGFKGGAAPARIVVLMALLIGPGEELFWRAYLQRRLSAGMGPWPGFILATALYTAVHLASGNIMLVLAALVCGLFWGYLYLRFQSPLLNALSHTVWDIAIFILFPLGIS